MTISNIEEGEDKTEEEEEEIDTTPSTHLLQGGRIMIEGVVVETILLTLEDDPIIPTSRIKTPHLNRRIYG